MPKLTLFLNKNRFLTINNLNRLWITKNPLAPEYCQYSLWYSDDNWEKRRIYCSHDSSVLFKCKEEISNAYRKGIDTLTV